MEKGKKLIALVLIIAFAVISFAFISPKVSDPQIYSKSIASLDETRTHALELTGAAAGMATVAALVPGDATTPIANKLMDVSGYMVIVLVAIIVEKYLLTLTGTLAFKIMIPIACIMVALALLLHEGEGRRKVSRFAAKIAIVSILLWTLVPSSIMVTNIINDAYENTSSVVIEQTVDVDKNVSTSTSTKKSDAVKSSLIKKIADKAKAKYSAVASWTDAKKEQVINECKEVLTSTLEKLALLIVTTCVIPILVLIFGMWIIKLIMGISLPTLKLPKASSLKHKEEIE